MKTKYIFNYAFVIGLIVLLVNDHYLKGLFGNWYTGKLSDFAGMFILPMFFAFCFNLKAKPSILWAVVFFIFWKSSLSQGFIDSFNSLGILSIGRVIDYSDFLAFLILPFSKYVLEHVQKFEIKIDALLFERLAFNGLFLLTLFTFFATSVEETSNIVPRQLTMCCELAPINQEIGNGKIFIPTAFTPDGDGINDFFQPVIDSNILRIDTFLVFDASVVDTVFQMYDIEVLFPGSGFNGVVDFRVRTGQFSYFMRATSKDEISESFSGTFCSMPCDEIFRFAGPDSISNCAFGNQFDQEVGYDESIDSKEELECYF